jgi:peptidoglycan/LPS O-acetylase OafA/YrhL
LRGRANAIFSNGTLNPSEKTWQRLTFLAQFPEWNYLHEIPVDSAIESVANRPRLAALTSLRFFAALHVVIFHLYTMHITVGPAWYRNLSSIGYVGVGLFFVLSGFILVYTYAGRSWTARTFWQARIARIYPAYLFSLFVTAPSFFYVTVVLKNLDLTFHTWFKSHLFVSWSFPLLLLQSWIPQAALAWNPPAWSLSDEAFFYLLFPLLILWLIRASRRKLAALAFATWLLSLTFSVSYAFFKPDGVMHVDDQSPYLFWLNVVKFHPLARVPEFLLGACLGFLFLRNSIGRKWATSLVLFGLLMSVVAVAFSSHIPYTILHDSLLTPAFGTIIYGLALRPSWAGILEIKPMQLLGDSSYSLYLLHSLMIGIYFNPYGGMRYQSLGGVLLGIGIMLGVSILAYLYIEQPARLLLRPKEKQLPVTAEAAKAW